MLKAIHAQEDRQVAEEKIVAVTKKLKSMKLTNAARIVEEGAKETLSYLTSPVSIGAHCEPIIPWKGSCGRSEEEQRLWELSRTGNLL